MKKLTAIFFIFTMIFTLVACNNGKVGTIPPTSGTPSITPSTPEQTAPSQTESPSEEKSAKILIAYFAMPETDGVDAVSSASRVIVDGQLLANTEHIAQLIEKETGGELFRIETVQEYPGVHAPLLDFAQKELSQKARPELKSSISDINDYDVIFVGFPNWWADMPMPLYTFFDEYDLSGKTIVPFSTHGGSGFSRTISTIAELEPSATVITDGLTVSRNSIASAESTVTEWVRKLGYHNTASGVSSAGAKITLSIDSISVTAELDDSDIARQFAALLPQTISMTRGRDREYYGGITGSLDYDEKDIVRTAKDGDIAYWFSGNSLAFFFGTENDSAVNSGIVVFGKITSDLSVFDNMKGNETMTVSISE